MKNERMQEVKGLVQSDLARAMIDQRCSVATLILATNVLHSKIPARHPDVIPPILTQGKRHVAFRMR